MALWGITDADESKPKWLTTAQKKEIYANNSGWVVEGGSSQTGNDNADAQPEVLCCVGDLATAVGSADIGEVEWITTTADKSDGFTLSVRIRWNELVTVDTSVVHQQSQLPMETKVLDQVEDHTYYLMLVDQVLLD